ncbi:hypothetical protein A5657_03035 [Mycobacterium kubicae]|nr:hypothetical protein A5657_03035 [Mycobacterium kubicae]
MILCIVFGLSRTPADARRSASFVEASVTLRTMATGDWPRSYVIPSFVLSLTAASFLLWHVLDPARKIDGWAITLLVVAFLPWLRTVFESITFLAALPSSGSERLKQSKYARQRK